LLPYPSVVQYPVYYVCIFTRVSVASFILWHRAQVDGVMGGEGESWADLLADQISLFVYDLKKQLKMTLTDFIRSV